MAEDSLPLSVNLPGIAYAGWIPAPGDTGDSRPHRDTSTPVANTHETMTPGQVSNPRSRVARPYPFGLHSPLPNF